MLLSEVKKKIPEKKPWWIEQASEEILTLCDMFSSVQGYKLDFSPVTHFPDMLYMYNDTHFKYPDDPKYQDEIDYINDLLERRHLKNTRNMLCAIAEKCEEDANGEPVFKNFKASVTYVSPNSLQEGRMWGYLGEIYFPPKAAKELIPAIYNYCTSNFIIYAIDAVNAEHQQKPYEQFLIHKAIKDYEELKQLAEVLSI